MFVYKHALTRRYLFLDSDGQPYRFVPARDDSGGHGRYLEHRNLHEALDHLDLWELPWMKQSLNSHRGNMEESVTVGAL